MTRIFLYGTLRHLPLLAVVLGRAPDPVAAALADHSVVWAEGQNFPVLRRETGGTAPGILIDCTAQEVARLDFYEGPFGYALDPVTVRGPSGDISAKVYRPVPGVWSEGGPFDLEDWVAVWGEIVTVAAPEIMAAYGTQDAEAVAARSDIILARAQAHVNTSRWHRPRSIGQRIGAGRVSRVAHRYEHTGFFTLEQIDLTHPRFEGGAPMQVSRTVFRAGEAVTVLPYDPVRDRVLLVEQFRAAPFLQGDPDPWLLEPVAGIMDAGEGAESTARREAREEADVTLGALHFVGRYYPSPGATAQVLHSYLGLADLPDTLAKTGGLAEEGEDIAVHLVDFSAAMAAMESGEIAVAPLIMTLQWLAAHRDGLRAGA